MELISIIIATYGTIGLKYVKSCVHSILKNTKYPRYEIIIVNYGTSEKLTLECLLNSNSNVTDVPILILNIPRNLGYSGANNLGLKHARGEYIVLLNNDTRVTKGWLTRLYETLKSDDLIIAVQSKLRLMDFPDRIDSVGHTINPLGFLRAKGYLEKDVGQYDEQLDICVIQPASCIMRREALENIGLFDELFFWGHEDTDFSLRARICGYKLVLEPRSIVYHRRSPTISQAEEEFIIYYSRRNMLMTMIKNYEMKTLFIILPVHLFLILVMSLWYLFRRKPNRKLKPLNKKSLEASKRLSCFMSVVYALIWILKNMRVIIKGRYAVQSMRKISDKELFKVMDRIDFHRIIKSKKYGSLMKLHLELAKIPITLLRNDCPSLM